VAVLSSSCAKLDPKGIYVIYMYIDGVFLKSVGGKCAYWSKFVRMLNIQFHICDDLCHLFDKYVGP